MIVWILLAALTLVTPRDGAVVPLLSKPQKAYLEGDRPERFLRLDSPADRAKLSAMGARQVPLRFSWTGGRGPLYELTITAERGSSECFTVSNRTEAHVTNLEQGRIYRWTVRDVAAGTVAADEFATEDLPPRFLSAEGLSELRDAGGWTTFADRRIRSGRIFRSSALRAASTVKGGFFRKKVRIGPRLISGSGIAMLRDDLGIRTDIDLRPATATAGLSASELGADVRWRNVPFPAYGEILRPEGREAFLAVMRELVREDAYPVLLHGADGAGRTGTLVFLLNGLLGVQEEDLCKDLEASAFGGAADLSADDIRTLVRNLHACGDGTMNDCIETYARQCGVSASEIDSFRTLMLE